MNLSNEALLTFPSHEFINATKHNKVVFELSEVFTNKDTFDLIATKVNELSALGLVFALDDFGNGRDGLHRLYSLDKVGFVKIDGAFLRMCLERHEAAFVLKSLVALWKKAGLMTTAEWVESPELMAFAVEIGFDAVQGWYVDRILNGELATAA